MHSTRTRREPTDAARQTAGTARQEGREVAHSAAEEARDVSRDVRHEGREVAEQARSEARHVMEDAKSQLRGQAQEQTKRVTESLHRLGDQVTALAQGRPQEAGRLADYVDQAAGEIQQAADRVETRGFDGVVRDTENFARRRPGAFLAAAAATGFLAGRALRGGSEAHQEQEHQGRERQFSGDGHREPGDSWTAGATWDPAQRQQEVAR
ncbi:hypothetical protein SAMN05216266_107283 [Amycolatopsis marina]|uniref:Uncharacterized protein n=1 Tax=Amycolatopsis marina TaxID=490629 RepID=A0A1I0ZVD6_9PSEU|nr:hypothetical protein [Amycolatopsis marina]SFB29026.1 hypothetical protein SAMN05216266_107283 [Amycolatopsis marina]